MRLYNPFCCGRSSILSCFLASPHDVARLNRRRHNKLFLADGVMAVIGGRNIADEYFLLSGSQNFIDMDAPVIGQVVPSLEETFYGFWNSMEVWPITEMVMDRYDVHGVVAGGRRHGLLRVATFDV
ncbi:MAG: hypothetical protein H7Y19_09515 [Luteimonas sp.]|nr:hypothetical protein [Luteimonas sp.]